MDSIKEAVFTETFRGRNVLTTNKISKALNCLWEYANTKDNYRDFKLGSSVVGRGHHYGFDRESFCVKRAEPKD